MRTYLFLLQDFCEGAVYTFCIEIKAQLSDNETPSSFEEIAVCAEEL